MKDVEQITATWLTTGEVAEMFGVHPETIRNWVSEGILPAYKPGKALRFKRADVIAHLEQAKVRTGEEEE